MSFGLFENSHSYFSDDPPPQQENDKYLLQIKKLHEKCQQIQKENERLIFRLHAVRKLTKKQTKDVALLKNRLDLYNDDWRTAQPPAKLRKTVIKKSTPKATKGVNGQKGKTLNRQQQINGEERNPIEQQRPKVVKRNNPQMHVD